MKSSKMPTVKARDYQHVGSRKRYLDNWSNHQPYIVSASSVSTLSTLTLNISTSIFREPPLMKNVSMVYFDLYFDVEIRSESGRSNFRSQRIQVVIWSIFTVDFWSKYQQIDVEIRIFESLWFSLFPFVSFFLRDLLFHCATSLPIPLVAAEFFSKFKNQSRTMILTSIL